MRGFQFTWCGRGRVDDGDLGVGIWAAGDVTGGLQFTHAAGRMAWVAASNALSKLARIHNFRFGPSAGLQAQRVRAQRSE